MPQYTVYLPGGGSQTVNAKNLTSALGNVPGSTSSPAAPSSSGGGGGGGGGGGAAQGTPVYNTVNGQKTPTQMAAELKAAGWGGDPNNLASVVNAYATTTGGSATPAGGGWPGGGGGVPGGGAGAGGGIPPPAAGGGGGLGEQLQGLLAAIASGNKQDFDERVRQFNVTSGLDRDKFNEYIRQYNQSFGISEAGITGAYKGAPTLAALTGYAGQFGTWGVPTTGQQTLAGQKQAFDEQQALAAMYGTGFAPGQQAAAGQQTLSAQEQYYRQALDAERQRQTASQAYLDLLSRLRGPQDYGQYLKTMSSTPGGLQDLVRAAAGQYVPGVGTTGAQPQSISLAGMINQATGAPGNAAWTGGVQQPGMNYAMGGAQPQPGMQQYDVMPNQQNQLTWIGHQGGGPSREAQALQQGTGMPGANTSYQQYMQQAQNLPPPNQIAPASLNAMTPTQRQMLLGMYEQMGWTPEDVSSLYSQSLPKYAMQTPATGTFRLQ